MTGLRVRAKPGFKRKFISILFAYLVIGCSQLIFTEGVKIVHIPGDVKVEENADKEIFVHNLSEEEIYISGFTFIIDDFIYYSHPRPVELIKLTLEGKVVKRLKNYGRGPGEFVTCFGLNEYKGNIVFVDQSSMKLLIYTKNLEFLREAKITRPFLKLLINNNNELVLYSEGTTLYYFNVYNEYGKLLRNFGKPIIERKDNRKILLFDSVRYTLYLPEKDGIWASFSNRYDLRYYEKEKLKVEIKASKRFFKGEEQNFGGRRVMIYSDVSSHLARIKNELYYFYHKDNKLFCDIFDLNNYRLLSRIRLKYNYRGIRQYVDNIFYGHIYDANEDIILYKILINRR